MRLRKYEDFGIEQIIVHRDYINIFNFDIAQIPLNGRIQFGPKMKPICLPFGDNHISKPSKSDLLISYGKSLATGRGIKVFVNGRDDGGMTTISLNNFLRVRISRNLSPLMYAFETYLGFDRMVLEGVSSDMSMLGGDFIFTNVRKFGDWLDENMKM